MSNEKTKKRVGSHEWGKAGKGELHEERPDANAEAKSNAERTKNKKANIEMIPGKIAVFLPPSPKRHHLHILSLHSRSSQTNSLSRNST